MVIFPLMPWGNTLVIFFLEHVFRREYHGSVIVLTINREFDGDDFPSVGT